MGSNNKKIRCLWSALLAVTVAGCISVLHVFIRNMDAQVKNSKNSGGISHKESLTDEVCIPVCENKDCVSFANFLLRNMKSDADPCENVNKFACGAYEEKFTSDETRNTHTDTETTMFKIMDDILKNIKADPETASGKMKTLYDSCMNYVSTEKHALPTAQKVLNDIGIPNWPKLTSNFQFAEDISIVLGKLKTRGEQIFLKFAVPQREPGIDDFPLNETYDISIRLDIPYFDSLLELSEKSAAINVLKYFDLDCESIEEIWADYETVQNSIMKLKDENCRDISDSLQCSPSKITEGNNSSPDCNNFKEAGCYPQKWLYPDPYYGDCPESNITCSVSNYDSTYICKFAEVFLNSSDLRDQINKTFIKIDTGDGHFVRNIIPMLKNFPDKTVSNFFALNFYLRHLGELNFYFQLTEKRYIPYKRCEPWKQPVLLDRWRVCTKWIADNMFFAAQYEFQKNYLTLQENEKFISLFEELREELAEVISHQDWIDEKDKEKLHIENIQFSFMALKTYQLHPQKYEHLINAYYGKFHPRADNFLHNALELKRTTSDMHPYNSPISQWLLSFRFDANAMYSCGIIKYDFGKLVPNHYVPGVPRVMNLFVFAVFAAHELAHHVDLAIKYELRNDELKQARKERQKCLINQFSQFKYEFTDDNLKGKQFVSENIPDNVAILIIDRLLEKYSSAHEDILLPGFHNSFKQIMYIAMSQLFCSRVANKDELFYRTFFEHTPLKLRSIGPMQNSKGYSEAFSCPEGSYMNPSTKCAFLDDM